MGEWGLPRSVLKDYRVAHLVKPTDFRLEREIILTSIGLAKLREHFGIQDKDVLRSVMVGDVVRWDWRNSRMVEVRCANGELYRVRVRNALKWRPDRDGKFMRIKFHRDGDQYRQVGRSPRYPGIW